MNTFTFNGMTKSPLPIKDFDLKFSDADKMCNPIAADFHVEFQAMMAARNDEHAKYLNRLLLKAIEIGCIVIEVRLEPDFRAYRSSSAEFQLNNEPLFGNEIELTHCVPFLYPRPSDFSDFGQCVIHTPKEEARLDEAIEKYVELYGEDPKLDEIEVPWGSTP